MVIILVSNLNCINIIIRIIIRLNKIKCMINWITLHLDWSIYIKE
jgi:hypothetical protein